jgi:hypothetical protein
MVLRRYWLRFLVLLAVAFSAPTATAQSPMRSSSDTVGAEVASLKEQLKDGLRARLPRELVFLDRVVELVDAGQLSQELVRSTLTYARKKKPYPFPYFERALRLRAAQRGVTI